MNFHILSYHASVFRIGKNPIPSFICPIRLEKYPFKVHLELKKL